MSLRVIVTTASGREENLRFCLELLSQQHFANFDGVVVDDGSTGARTVTDTFLDSLNLIYVWRFNDMCLSHSRNLGAQKAQGDFLVFIDGDILLNPEALSAYQQAFMQYPDRAVLAYCGNQNDYAASSLLSPGRNVNYLDKRMVAYHRQALTLDPVLFQTPYFWAWGGNIGIPRSLFEAVGVFDERYWGWGAEDVQMGLDLNQAGYGFIFSCDAWGEHQAHPRQEGFHRRRNAGKQYTVPGQQRSQDLCVMPESKASERLRQFLFEKAFPQDLGQQDPIWAACLAYPNYTYFPGGALQ